MRGGSWLKHTREDKSFFRDPLGVGTVQTTFENAVIFSDAVKSFGFPLCHFLVSVDEFENSKWIHEAMDMIHIT